MSASEPAIGDPVVSDGIKYRIKEISGSVRTCWLVVAGPSWRRGQILAFTHPGRLSWDKVAGVWRGPMEPIA